MYGQELITSSGIQLTNQREGKIYKKKIKNGLIYQYIAIMIKIMRLGFGCKYESDNKCTLCTTVKQLNFYFWSSSTIWS